MAHFIQKLGKLTAIVLLLGAISLPVVPVTAHEQENPAVLAAEESANPTSYKFIASEGDALSYIVRRSIQLYTTAQSQKLEPAAALYVENKVVTELGAADIEIGQMVEVPFDAISRFINSSRLLTPDELAAWQSYVELVSFEVGDISPLSTAEPSATNPPATDDHNDEPAATPEQSEDQASGISKKVWQIIAVAASTAFTLYFIVSSTRPNNKNNAKKQN